MCSRRLLQAVGRHLRWVEVMSSLQQRDTCSWCGGSFPAGVRVDSKHCSKRCRQTAWRARQTTLLEQRDVSLRMAYADPPYPGFAWMYKDHPDYGGEVDHVALVARLQTYDGWALSTDETALRYVLPLCPEGTRVLPWVKPIGVPSTTRGAHKTWEPLLIWPGRNVQPGFRNWLSAMPARGGGDLIGRKPLKFIHFLFKALGMQPGDQFDDLFPGSGIVGRTWREVSSAHAVDASTPATSDALQP